MVKEAYSGVRYGKSEDIFCWHSFESYVACLLEILWVFWGGIHPLAETVLLIPGFQELFSELSLSHQELLSSNCSTLQWSVQWSVQFTVVQCGVILLGDHTRDALGMPHSEITAIRHEEESVWGHLCSWRDIMAAFLLRLSCSWDMGNVTLEMHFSFTNINFFFQTFFKDLISNAEWFLHWAKLPK